MQAASTPLSTHQSSYSPPMMVPWNHPRRSSDRHGRPFSNPQCKLQSKLTQEWPDQIKSSINKVLDHWQHNSCQSPVPNHHLLLHILDHQQPSITLTHWHNNNAKENLQTKQHIPIFYQRSLASSKSPQTSKSPQRESPCNKSVTNHNFKSNSKQNTAGCSTLIASCKHAKHSKQHCQTCPLKQSWDNCH